MEYPFIRSYQNYGVAKGPRLGLVWHHAEGGGTVGYLSRPNPNGVAVHFVVERTGRIVQMLRLDHANGSIRPTAIRKDDDRLFMWKGTPIIYGRTAARAVLGKWADDPNSATLGVEVEGYAKDGPNPLQVTAMGRLWADLSARYPAIHSLGHRDFASYKACPGRLIPWERLGGHGADAQPDTSTGGDAVKSFNVPEARMIATVRDLAWLYDNSALAASDNSVRVSPGREFVFVGKFSADVWIVAYEPTGGDAGAWSKAMFIRRDDITSTRVETDTTTYTRAQVDAAKDKGWNAGRAAALAAVTGVPTK